MKSQPVNQKVCIKQNGSFTDCCVKVWRHADGTIVLDDGKHRFVQRPTRHQSPVFKALIYFYSIISQVTRALFSDKAALK